MWRSYRKLKNVYKQICGALLESILQYYWGKKITLWPLPKTSAEWNKAKQAEMCRKPDYSRRRSAHPTPSQNLGVAGLQLPQSIWLFVLVCDFRQSGLLLKTLKSHTQTNWWGQQQTSICHILWGEDGFSFLSERTIWQQHKAVKIRTHSHTNWYEYFRRLMYVLLLPPSTVVHPLASYTSTAFPNEISL